MVVCVGGFGLEGGLLSLGLVVVVVQVQVGGGGRAEGLEAVAQLVGQAGAQLSRAGGGEGGEEGKRGRGRGVEKRRKGEKEEGRLTCAAVVTWGVKAVTNTSPKAP